MQNLTLNSILSPALITVAQDTPLTEVLTSMDSLRAGCIVAIDDERHPLGIFTEQDVIRLMAEARFAENLRMADVMNVQPLTASGDMDFRDAYRLISEKDFSHLIVVDSEGRLEGVINGADFLHHLGLEYLLELKTVSTIMTRNVQTIAENATLSDAVNMMATHKSGGVVVARDHAPVGILTERDLVSLAREIADPATTSITRVMKSPAQTIHADSPLKMAARKMEETGIRSLVVMKDNVIAGLVTHHDIVKATQGRCIDFLHETLERQRRDLNNAQTMIEQTRQQLLLRSLMDQINDAVFVADANSGKILDANNEASLSLGYTREELLQLNIVDISVRMRHGTSWQSFLDKFSTSGQQVIESRHRRRDGSEFPVEINIRLLQRDNQQYFVAVARDLTNLRQQEAQLRLHVAALNASANAIVLTDRKAVIQWSNKAFSDMTGYSLDEAVDKQPGELIKSGVQTREFYAALWQTILSGQVWRGEVINKRKDGTLYQEEMTITPVRTENDEITHFIAIKQDITARKQAEDASRKSEALLSSSQRMAHIGSWELDLIDNVLSWSDENYRIFEIDPDKFGASYEAFLNAVHPDDRAMVNNAYTESLKDKTPYSIEHRLLFPDQRVKYVREWCETYYDKEGRPIRSVGTTQDITERRQTEEKLRSTSLYARSLIEASLDPLVTISTEGKITDVNEATIQATGVSRSQLIGSDFSGYFTEPYKARAGYREVFDKGFVTDYPLSLRHVSGSITEVLYNATVYHNEKGEVAGVFAAARDITAHKQAEKTVQESNDKLNALIEAIPDAIFFKDGESRWLITNEPAKQLFSLHGFDWYGKTEMELAAARPEFRAAHENCLIDDEKAWKAGKLSLFEEYIVDEAGRGHDYEVRKVPVFGNNNERKGLVIIGRDISERKQVEEQLREAAAVMQSTHEGVVICDTSPRIIAVNTAYSTITGFSAEEIIGNSPSILSSGHPDKSFHETMWQDLLTNGHWQGEVWNRRKSGEIYPQLLTISTVYDDQRAPVRYVGVFADISQLKQNQAQLEFMALHDPLTRLPNRSLVEQRLKQEIDQAHRHGHRVGVLFIDLDRFKLVNDSFGHLVGDELLCDVALRLGARLREGDTLGRLGGDEFILVVSPLRETQDAAVVARDFTSILSEPFKLPDGHEVFIGGSIGISLYPQDGETVSELMKNADAAMYLAKENGRNQFSFYSKELNADARSKLAMENDLRRAVMQNELTLHYQPIVDLHSGKICGAEALARWRMADGRWISPTKFIPISEKSGVILNIGNWVIEQVCKQIRNWLDEGLANVRIAINISARQFRSGNLDKLVAQALKKYKIDAQHLGIELTESILMHEHDEAVATMQKLKQIGVKISLDDFGTGYSSFSYLSRFPIDTLKIDQSFVRNVVIERDATEIASAIIGLAHRMGLRVVAEGVETEAQLAYLRENGCDEIQGYRFSTPLSPQGFADLLRSGKTLPSAEEVCPVRTLLIVCDEPDKLKEIELSLHGEEYRILTSGNTHAGLELLALNQVQVILTIQHLTVTDGPDFLRSAVKIHPHTIRMLLSDSHDDLATLNQAVNTGLAYKLITRPIAEEHLRKHILEAFAYYEVANQTQRAQ